MQKFITHLKSITPLTEQQEADVKSELERLMEVSDFYGIDYDNPNPPETEPTPEEQREADIYWESVRCHSLTLGGYMLKEIN